MITRGVPVEFPDHRPQAGHDADGQVPRTTSQSSQRLRGDSIIPGHPSHRSVMDLAAMARSECQHVSVAEASHGAIPAPCGPVHAAIQNCGCGSGFDAEQYLERLGAGNRMTALRSLSGRP